MEAIVSSDYRQRMKAPAPAVGGPLLDHAYSGREALAAALLSDRWRGSGGGRPRSGDGAGGRGAVRRKSQVAMSGRVPVRGERRVSAHEVFVAAA